MPTDEPKDKPPEDPRISVMDWVLGVGRVVVRKFASVPRSPMARLYAKR